MHKGSRARWVGLEELAQQEPEHILHLQGSVCDSQSFGPLPITYGDSALNSPRKSYRSYSTEAPPPSIAMVTSDYASFPPRLQELRQQLLSFMAEHVLPAEGLLGGQGAEGSQRWVPRPLMEELKVRDMGGVLEQPSFLGQFKSHSQDSF